MNTKEFVIYTYRHCPICGSLKGDELWKLAHQGSRFIESICSDKCKMIAIMKGGNNNVKTS